MFLPTGYVFPPSAGMCHIQVMQQSALMKSGHIHTGKQEAD
ncbi:hypothetical protein [Robinsoniella sp. KNHs210]|nr:hypothetical protein [Robinsoniella sp. KNHs210]